mmetsp:Transcript_33346/g.72133  ORF Transcript_33346/g.72133 Transcript_33346/m.72133 type:complete len:218 (-) Transcript_33346:1382-2035(-)
MALVDALRASDPAPLAVPYEIWAFFSICAIRCLRSRSFSSLSFFSLASASSDLPEFSNGVIAATLLTVVGSVFTAGFFEATGTRLPDIMPSTWSRALRHEAETAARSCFSAQTRAFSILRNQSTSNLVLSRPSCLASLITLNSQIRSIILDIMRVEQALDLLTRRIAVSSHLSNTIFPATCEWALLILNIVFITFLSLRRIASEARRMDSMEGMLGR